ncbi:MAG: O-antigen ligase family protein [Armatimonadota bacterium]
MPVIFVLAVAMAVTIFVLITAKGPMLAIAFGAFVAMLIYAFTSAGAAILCLILAAYFEALYKGAAPSLFTMVVKDLFLIIAVLRLLFISQRQRDFRWIAQPFTTSAAVFFIYCIALMFAPSTRSILLALAGFRTWVLWMPMYFPAYAYLTDKKTIIRFLTLLLILQLPVQIYGIVQGNIGYEHTKVIPGFYEITKWYKVDVDLTDRPEDAEAGSAGIDDSFKPIMNVRACSITISPGTFGSMAALTILLSLGLLAYTSSPKLRLWSLITALASAGGLLASGSRTPMVGLLAGILVMLAMSRHRFALVAGMVVIGLGAAIFLKDVSGGGAVRLQKTLTVQGAIERSMYPMMKGLSEGLVHPFGNGIATGTGMGRMFYSAGLKMGEGASFIENEFARSLVELGLVGSAIWLTMLLTAMWRCFCAVRAMGNRPEASLCAALLGVLVAIFVQLGVGSALYPAQPGMYFWLFTAVIIRLGEHAAAERPSEAATVRRRPERMRRYGFIMVPESQFPQQGRPAPRPEPEVAEKDTA